jgi:hypothetical protein
MATTVRQVNFSFSCSTPENILNPKNILKVLILFFQHFCSHFPAGVFITLIPK